MFSIKISVVMFGKEGEWTIVTERSMDAGTHKLNVSTRRMYIFKGRDENIVVDKTNLPKKDQKEKMIV